MGTGDVFVHIPGIIPGKLSAFTCRIRRVVDRIPLQLPLPNLPFPNRQGPRYGFSGTGYFVYNFVACTYLIVEIKIFKK